MLVTYIVTGGGHVLVEDEKMLELALADVDGVGVGLEDGAVVLVDAELEDEVWAGGLVIDAGAGELEPVPELELVVVVVVACAGRLGDEGEGDGLLADELRLAGELLREDE